MLFPQDKEDYVSEASHEENVLFILEESPYSASAILHALDIFKAILHNFTFRVVGPPRIQNFSSKI
ncbi:hypothetical protein D8M06_14405 [Oceanobacillus halophilus]|uniref:Uncharacterized protein n=1 Tax=Oceanobacillus halophilus TaxID=930130 RepID=A0A494ZX16_9BACI|nr:hypothetical protein D8M06_14405 [Oceanobacillus halophilus]